MTREVTHARHDTPVLGAVLTGGASTRMGRDKATIEVDGVAMAERVAAALRGAGARAVGFIGSTVPDLYPGDGPLGGIVTALRWASDDVVVIAPCDMPWIQARHVRALADALGDHDVAYAEGQHLVAAWAPSARAAIEEAFSRGERAPRRALTQLQAIAVDLGDGAWARDVDTPEDLEPG
jgi:molybdenum cofactor guanylyltransferase